MRRGWSVLVGALVVLALIGVGVGAYNAGLDAGVRHAADAGRVVEVVGGPAGYGWHGYGFFPFGFLFFPLVLIGIFLLVRFAVGGPRGWDHHHGWAGPGMHGPWSEEARGHLEDRFGEWHRREHDRGSSSPDPAGGGGTGA